MTMDIRPKLDIDKLIADYYSIVPNIENETQRVYFGTAGHRGSSSLATFNECHVLAIAQAICDFRKKNFISGPMFVGRDTHALSWPAYQSVITVMAANQIQLLVDDENQFVPTPVISQAILTYNQEHQTQLADGIVLTSSHNPPQDGGIKYNATNGGAASLEITSYIAKRANEYLADQCKTIKRIDYKTAKILSMVQFYDFMAHYIAALPQVLDLTLIREKKIKIAVDPLGGAGIYYWPRIAETYHLDLTVVNLTIDPTFNFIPADIRGIIRMDPTSTLVMQNLINKSNSYDVGIGCDTDHDRQGIVTPAGKLLPTHHYLTLAINYLFHRRTHWSAQKKIGKTIVTSQLIDRLAKKLKHDVYEVPVGFKWFAQPLVDGLLGFAGEQSAGCAFNRINGNVWTSDKDAIVMGLLAAEMTAFYEEDLAIVFQYLTREIGQSYYDHLTIPATFLEKEKLAHVKKTQLLLKELAGEPILNIRTQALGNNADIDGIKVESAQGWFVIRPSGTENLNQIFAESLINETHLHSIVKAAKECLEKLLIN